MLGSMEGEGRPRPRRFHSAYTALSLTAPTLYATVLGLVDHPTATTAYALVAGAILLLGTQQVCSLVTSEAWPGSAPHRFRVPAWFVSRPALFVGVVVAIAVGAYGFAAGRPVFLWAVPAAAAIGVLTLDVTEWDREVPRWTRGAMALVLGPVLALVAVAVFVDPVDPLDHPQLGLAVIAVIAVVAVVALVLVLQVGQVWWDRVVTELSTAREALIATTISKERLRFAGELHDLQGHELQVIMLRADLGATTLRVKGAAAADEAMATFTDIRDTAQRALQQTRDVVHAYRRASFAQEIGNVREILKAAGVTATVVGPVDEVDGEAAHLAGLLIREATTNLLRHSRTAEVRIEVARRPDGFSVGFIDPGPTRALRTGHVAGSGLRSLAERARGASYRVTAGPAGLGWSVHLTPEEP